MDAVSAAGIVITLANSIPVYKMMKNMNPKGKVINTAWLVPATAALGDHLGFTAGVRPDMITPVVLGKLFAEILAIALAIWFTKDLKYALEQSEKMELENAPSSETKEKTVNIAMKYSVGIDPGTTGTTAILFNEEWNIGGKGY